MFTIGASIGLTPVNRRVRTLNEILTAADNACYQAKERGRNQVCEQEASAVPERRQENQGWLGRVASALAENRLQIEAIPLHPLHAGLPPGHCVELSARLHEPGQPPIALSALIDAAERYDLAASIDLRFIETALDALERARDANQPLYCLVPLSRNSVGRRALLDYISRNLTTRNLSGAGLSLLLPDDISPHQSSQIAEFSRLARSLGCSLGLSEFDGGINAFAFLRNIAPSHVKLGRSLTRDLGGNRAATALLRAIQEITTDLGIHTIADNINDPLNLDQLAELGISYAQGSAVATEEPFEDWLEGVVFRNC